MDYGGKTGQFPGKVYKHPRYRYKDTYKEKEFKPYINGRKVRAWKLIDGDDDFPDEWEYVPLFYTRRERRRRK